MEREVVTVALGNYSTLVSAQWANGTSHFDVHHSTLYRERRAHHVEGGRAEEQRSGGIIRVPRLLLLDSPHVGYFQELAEVEEEASLADPRVPNDGSEASHDGTSGGNPDERISRVVERARHKWWDVEDEEDDDQLRKTLEQEAYTSYTDPLSNHTDPNNGHGFPDRAKEIDDADEKPSSPRRREALRRHLFAHNDGTVAWWRYITTGLERDSIVALRPSHSVDSTGAVPSLHSFGYGLARIKSSLCAEMDGLADGLRRQLEDANGLQGLQCFTDGDSLFGGAAHNLLEEFWEDAGPKVPVVIFASFTPLPFESSGTAADSGVSFLDRRQDEVKLNRLLATSALSSHPSAVYIPAEVGQWEQFFQQADGEAPKWIREDTSTAQYLAAVADSALFGLRDGAPPPSSGSAQVSEEPKFAGPAYYMHDWCRTVRPCNSLRVASLMGTLPLRVHDARRPNDDLWHLLQDTPLLPEAQRATYTARGGEVPLASSQGGFVSLTHAMQNSPNSQAGRVLGHAVTLRGAGVLPSNIYPTHNAMIHYALPLGTSTYLPLVTRTGYPVSSTFPMGLVFPQDQLEALQANASAGTPCLSSVDTAAHVLSTYNAASMLNNTATAAKEVIQHRMHLHRDTYAMEDDEWRERLEDVLEMYDDYHHGDGDDEDDIE